MINHDDVFGDIVMFAYWFVYCMDRDFRRTAKCAVGKLHMEEICRRSHCLAIKRTSDFMPALGILLSCQYLGSSTCIVPIRLLGVFSGPLHEGSF